MMHPICLGTDSLGNLFASTLVLLYAVGPCATSTHAPLVAAVDCTKPALFGGFSTARLRLLLSHPLAES